MSGRKAGPMMFLRPDEVRSHMRTLTRFVEGADVETADSAGYFECLNRVQKLRIHVPDKAEPHLEFDLSEPAAVGILESLKRAPDLADVSVVEAVAIEDVENIVASVRAARRLLGDYDKGAAELVENLIASFLFVRVDGYFGGSFWHVLGAVWMSPKPGWTIHDYAENILHESVHQAMFLDDMVNTLFAAPPEVLSSEAMLITSSIRGTKRPFDFAFHAATVSAALIQFYEWLNVDKRAIELCEGVLETLVELDQKSYLLSERGRTILTRMIDIVATSSTITGLRSGTAA